jgi:myo-inositol-1(or 4)-monophosphatase
MKGKRKAKTSKWAMKFQFETEARRSMFARSEKASNRFLDAALHLGSVHEPLGRLAGALSTPTQKVQTCQRCFPPSST